MSPQASADAYLITLDMWGLQRVVKPQIIECSNTNVDWQGILKSTQPVVLRSVVKHWPAVQMALSGTHDFERYLLKLDLGKSFDVIKAPASVSGFFGYNDDFTGFNFRKQKQQLWTVFSSLNELSKKSNPASIAIQSADLNLYLPDFCTENQLNIPEIVENVVSPKMWLGNAITVAAHFDQADNIACCVAGRRRFTLLAPEQLENLYVGPLDFTPAGPPVSLVDLRQIDQQNYPKAALAMKSALTVELEPGDAIFIPRLWWHQVESVESINLLVNYWWNSYQHLPHAPMDVLFHALLAIKDLPDHERRIWKDMFSFYVFDAQPEKIQHIPEQVRGVLGNMSKQQRGQLNSWLGSRFRSE